MTSKFKAPPKPKTAEEFAAGAPSIVQPGPGDSDLVRVSIQITKQHHEALRRISFERSMKHDQRASQAELVREALDLWMQNKGVAK